MCVFCKIINNEIGSYKIYEDEKILAFLDISQLTIGHTLVIPKKHYETILDLDSETSKEIFDLVRKLSLKIVKATGAKGVNIINNNNEIAGQAVNHFHIHIIPRYNTQEFSFNTNPNKLTEEEFIELANKINN